MSLNHMNNKTLKEEGDNTDMDVNPPQKKRRLEGSKRVRSMKSSTRQKISSETSNMTIPGHVPRDTLFDVISAFASNVLYMREIITEYTFPKLTQQLELDECGQVNDTSLKKRRRHSSSRKVVSELLNTVNELKIVCELHNVATFAVFFGPSQSLPKIGYFLHFSPNELSISPANSASVNSESIVKSMLRKMVLFWSSCDKNMRLNTNFFFGVKLRQDSDISCTFSPKFVFKKEFDLLLRRKNKIDISNFTFSGQKMELPVPPVAGQKYAWFLTKKPIKIKRSTTS